jgi:hypothetical protein
MPGSGDTGLVLAYWPAGHDNNYGLDSLLSTEVTAWILRDLMPDPTRSAVFGFIFSSVVGGWHGIY